MNIEIDKAIVHTLDSLADDAQISGVCLTLFEQTTQYLCKIAQRAFESDDANCATFNKDSETLQLLTSLSDNFVDNTAEIARNWFSVMRENIDIPCADIIFLLLNIDGSEVFAALKLPRKNGYVHNITNGESRIEEIAGVLPTASGKPDEAFFISTKLNELRVIEKKYEIDGRKSAYLCSRILGCKIGNSPKEALDAICKAAVMVNEQFYGSLEVDEPLVCATIAEQYHKAPQELSAQRVCEHLYKDLPHAREAFEKALTAQDIPFDMPLEINAPTVRRLEKQSLRSGSGVEIKVPVSVYRNTDAVEFLKNDDGTTSLLIKNILV